MARKRWGIPVLAVLLTLAGAAEAAEARAALAAARASAHAIVGGPGDYDALLGMIGDARVVMLGEGTHGSREFYRERARISRRLIAEKGFAAVVLEAPWEPARSLDAHVRGLAVRGAALDGFQAYPRWMWRNVEVREFVDALRADNAARPAGSRPARIFGMDLYSVPQSADAVVRQVARRSVAEARRARERYGCFDAYRPEPMLYGRDLAAGRSRSCAAGAAEQLVDMAARAAAPGSDEEDFAAWQSARVVAAGEDFYGILYRGGESSWNRRERHMAETLDQILDHLGPESRIVVWAQNIHQGDARETDQGAVGELSLGQLMRERHGDAVRLVALTTYRGTVRASSGWGTRDRVWRLRPALAESWSGLLHRVGLPAFLLLFRGDPELAGAFAEPRLDRAVGVTYIPGAERRSHYFHMKLSRQFDALIHLDETRAVEPLPD